MELLFQELTGGLHDRRQLAVIVIRLVAATLLGAIVGLQREHARKPAGLRTHTLVCLGTALVVLAGSGFGMSPDGLSRVIQGIVTGIGFVGAGSILKLNEQREIHGLTTAAGLWMTAAIGVTVGLGAIGLAIIGTAFLLLVLAMEVVEESWRKNRQNQGNK
jgi:putative Mg2+ transporter-C (MgtC) family protein